MVYNANGKTYTDHPLMDEMIYHCRRILKGIVIKNDVLANNSETENSLQNAEMYYIIKEDGYIPFSVFPFDETYLKAFGYTNKEDIRGYIRDRNNIPESDRISLTRFCNKYFINNFEEENDYYRTLMGLPPFDSGEYYYVYLTKADIPAKYLSYVDLSVPLHLQETKVINVLYSTGNMDKIRASHPGSEYSYLNFLGNRSIDLYKARKAYKWDILYMPNVYYLVEDTFTELYKINRDIYMNQTYQEVHSDISDYYDQLMILIILSETFSNMITDTPEWYIRRDIFDIRSVKYFLESFGVAFYKEIPLKYQVRIVKNLNKIIKFKSSTKNIEDIIEIFTKDTVNIFKYWLFKKRKMDHDGKYIEGETTNDKYDLEFVTSDIYETFDDYIKDQIYRHPYDDITYSDRYWDGEDTHSYIHDTTIDRDFTIEGTKYMSIDYKFSLSEYLFQVEYFLGLVLDSNIDLEDIRIAIPTVDEIADFSLTNIFLYTIILSDSMYRKDKDDTALNIRYPEVSEGKKPSNDYLDYHDFNLYDWRVKNIPEIFIPKNGRVHAFNTNFDRVGMEKFIKTRRHSHYLFGASYENVDFDNPGKDTPLSNNQYKERAKQALDDLGINEFVTPLAKYDDINDLINLYRHDRKTYEILIEKIRETDDEDDLSTLAYIYQELYTREFDTNFYTLSNGKKATNLVEILKDRDFILYDSYYQIMNERNMEARQDIIRSVLNDVVETLEYYVSGEGLEYLFSFTPIESFFNIVYYIYLMINFFKSYKVYFLDPYMTMVVDNKMDPLDANVHIMDRVNEFKGTSDREDKVFITDSLKVEGELRRKDNDSENVKAEMVDIFGFHEDDPNEDIDYDGVTASRGEDITIKDMDGGIADDMQNIPYKELDAGNSYLGIADIDDLNGGDADDELYEDYGEINGGNAYHPYDERTDWFGSQGFNYDLDGGGSSNVKFRSRSLDTIVFANTISMNVRISERDKNSLMILDDGLYASNIMVDNIDFQIAMNDVANYVNNINFGDQGLLTELSTIDSFDDIVERINTCIEDYLYNMISSNNDVTNNELMNRVKTFINGIVSYLYSKYQDINPYTLVEL